MGLAESHDLDHEAIHLWFGLSYASYLTIPRSILQSMPDEWQKKFVELLDELDEKVTEEKLELPKYTVSARDARGYFIFDDHRRYDRGRRRLW